MEMIFISYRRSDSTEVARALAADLRNYFGDDSVFLDNSSALPPGQQWPQRIEEALKASRVVLALIGAQWLAAYDGTSGRRRIDLEDDWVRKELVAALARRSQGELFDLIPVLIDSTQMPSPEQLDADLLPLAAYQAARVRSGGGPHDFDELKDRLVQLRLKPRVLPPVNTPRVGKSP